MRKTKLDIINELNRRLAEFNQEIRISTLSDTELVLTSGIRLILESDIRKFIRRITNKKHTIWAENIDNLLAGRITETEIKSKLHAIGGKAVQEKYGALIRNNLNTGTPWNVGMKGNYPYSPGPRSAEFKHNISVKNSGSNNGMFGITMSVADKLAQSIRMKTLILEGKFTPNSNNRNTHWDACCNGTTYRSSWEALYAYLNETAEYETLRIPYILNDKEFIYIVDFIDHAEKIVIEIKPRELCVGEKFEAKMQALRNWAVANRYSVVVADQNYLQDQCKNAIIDYSRFDDKTAAKIKALNEISKKN